MIAGTMAWVVEILMEKSVEQKEMERTEELCAEFYIFLNGRWEAKAWFEKPSIWLFSASSCSKIQNIALSVTC